MDILVEMNSLSPQDILDRHHRGWSGLYGKTELEEGVHKFVQALAEYGNQWRPITEERLIAYLELMQSSNLISVLLGYRYCLTSAAMTALLERFRL